MKLIRRIVFFLGISLLCAQAAFAVEWDGKSPKWVGGGGCPDKIYFSIMDKFSVYEKYDVEYRIGNTPKQVWISRKTYTNNSATAEAIFPDDFELIRPPLLLASSLCGAKKIYWSTYVNGRKISAGVITNEVTQFEVNGKLISTERK